MFRLMHAGLQATAYKPLRTSHCVQALLPDPGRSESRNLSRGSNRNVAPASIKVSLSGDAPTKADSAAYSPLELLPPKRLIRSCARRRLEGVAAATMTAWMVRTDTYNGIAPRTCEGESAATTASPVTCHTTPSSDSVSRHLWLRWLGRLRLAGLWPRGIESGPRHAGRSCMRRPYDKSRCLRRRQRQYCHMNYHVAPMRLLWDCYVIAMWLPCDCYVIAR